MIFRSRQAKVLVVLVVSMILGVIFLRALGYHPPSAGAFCLTDYHRLAPVKTIVLYRTTKTPAGWKRIEIYRNSEIEKRDSLNSLISHLNTSCHFVIGNGRIGGDGQILPTEKWTQQKPADHPSRITIRKDVSDEQTVFICVITNGRTGRPTNYQLKRTEALVIELCRKLGIHSQSVCYPDDW